MCNAGIQITMLFVLASRDEPAAVSPLEAMAHSLPVVCSDSNGTRGYIRHGVNGFVFATDDHDDLVACLDRFDRRQEAADRDGPAQLRACGVRTRTESLRRGTRADGGSTRLEGPVALSVPSLPRRRCGTSYAGHRRQEDPDR